jgi:16S rRNA A1518/A1519 N6-dimethyltransferase RsmA/KsgA/DIM1 with predicted DNA glycosylase/AP lyase activity
MIINDGDLVFFQKGKELKQTDNGWYRTVILTKDGKGTMKFIHRLVAEYFVPNPNNYSVVNHIDEQKENNHYTNLEWCTHKYNVNYSLKNRKKSPRRRRKILQIKDGIVVNVFDGGKEAEANGYNQKMISASCIGIRKHYKGYEWKYAESEGAVKDE